MNKKMLLFLSLLTATRTSITHADDVRDALNSHFSNEMSRLSHTSEMKFLEKIGKEYKSIEKEKNDGYSEKLERNRQIQGGGVNLFKESAARMEQLMISVNLFQWPLFLTKDGVVNGVHIPSCEPPIKNEKKLRERLTKIAHDFDDCIAWWNGTLRRRETNIQTRIIRQFVRLTSSKSR